MAGRISLIVKGPEKSVRRAAQRHGVHIEACYTVGVTRTLPARKGGDVQCYARCTPGTNRNVVDWFSDRARTKPGRGHPPGTLLYHGSLCETNFGKRRRARR